MYERQVITSHGSIKKGIAMVLRVLKNEQFDLTDCLDLPKIELNESERFRSQSSKLGQIIKVRVKIFGLMKILS